MLTMVSRQAPGQQRKLDHSQCPRAANSVGAVSPKRVSLAEAPMEFVSSYLSHTAASETP